MPFFFFFGFGPPTGPDDFFFFLGVAGNLTVTPKPFIAFGFLFLVSCSKDFPFGINVTSV